MSPPVSVLIADDQDLVREGLRMLLQAEPCITVAAEAATGGDHFHEPVVGAISGALPLPRCTRE